MLIVDSQVHIWSAGTPNAIHRAIPVYSQDDLIAEMDAAGVDAAVLHPPAWDPGATDLMVEAARRHPDRFAVLGWLRADRTESRTLIAGWRRRPGMLGLRFAFLGPGEESWPRDGTMDWLWAAAEEAGLPVALLAAPLLPLVREVAEGHPRLRLLIDHMARARHAQDDAGFANLPELLALARYPNVAVKASGAPSYSSASYPWRNIHDHLRRIYDAFGPARMFWGTDITRMACPYRQCVTMFTEELPWLKGRDLELVMGRGLCDWLAWSPPPPHRATAFDKA